MARLGGGAEITRAGGSIAGQGLGQLSLPQSVRGVGGASATSVPPASGLRNGTNSSPDLLCPGSEAASLRGIQPRILSLWGARSLVGGRAGWKPQGDPHGSVFSFAACTRLRGMATRFRAASYWVSGDFLTF